MKKILMGVAYLIAASILAGAGVIGLSIDSQGNDCAILALIIAGFFFFTAFCYFAAAKDNEIKEFKIYKNSELPGDDDKEKPKDIEKDNVVEY